MRHEIKLRMLKYLHIIVTTVIFFFSWIYFRFATLNIASINKYGFRYNYFVAIIFAILFYFFARTYNAYMVGAQRIRFLSLTQLLSELLAVAITYIVTAVAWNQINLPVSLIFGLVVMMINNVFWSIFVTRIYFKYYPKKNVVVVYSKSKDKIAMKMLNEYPLSRQYAVEKYIKAPDSIDELLSLISEKKEIFALGLNANINDAIAQYCVLNGKNLYLLPSVGEILVAGSWHMQNFKLPVMFISKKSPKEEYLVLKRAFDIIMSLFGLVCLSPIMVITAIAIKLNDNGPVFYSHNRLTKDGKKFEIYKFRSMKTTAESDGVARLATENDDRITKVGKFIRKTRIDELPQLTNILKGDMSFVGPRPERPEIATEYEKELPEFALRLQVKAGLTGYAQVYGKYCTNPKEKLEFDLLYMNRMSIITDIQLLFATFAILFDKNSTQGF